MTEPFRTIVADPAWPFKDRLPGDGRGAAKHYQLTSMADLFLMACWDSRLLHIMDQPIATDAVLFLWRVAAMQQEALDTVRVWGFKPPTSEVIWLKKTVNGGRWFGMGRTVRAEHEVCLIARRGRPETRDHSVRSTFVTEHDFAGISALCERHSEKPELFYQIVERLFDGPYLELFARRQRPGWTCIGDQA
jgi:N6-adenosine-specific RNA methylase IME4